MSRTPVLFLALLCGCDLLGDKEEDAGDDSPTQESDGRVDPDPDGDGLLSDEEAALGTDPGDPDSDGDGLGDGEESGFGADPTLADTDGDGLDDGREVEAGSSPTERDTDGDGYLDPWEVTEGTDPADPRSVIYTGGWPYNPDKDAMPDPGFRGTASVGDRVPRFAYVDQFGDVVDIYDFAGQGRPVVIDLSGMWCYWCQELAKLMDGKRSELNGYGWDGVADQLAAGDFYFVTVLDSDTSGRGISADEVADWYASFENPYIPDLADENQDVTAWLDPYGYPTLLMADEDMVVTVYDSQDYTKVLDAMVDLAR